MCTELHPVWFCRKMQQQQMCELTSPPEANIFEIHLHSTACGSHSVCLSCCMMGPAVVCTTHGKHVNGAYIWQGILRGQAAARAADLSCWPGSSATASSEHRGTKGTLLTLPLQEGTQSPS